MSAVLTPSVVDFHGDSLLAVEIDGEQFVPMRPIVEALGLGWQSQHRKITRGKLRHHKVTQVMFEGQAREMVCLPLSKLNGWLFSVNPNKVAEGIRGKVIQYQEECFAVLYRHFLGGGNGLERTGNGRGATGQGAGGTPALQASRARAYPMDLQNRAWFRGKAVLASSSLAVFFRTDAKTLSNLKRGPRGLFEEGVHFFDLKGDDVDRFYEEARKVAVCLLPTAPPVHGLTLFTDAGARQLALCLGGDAQDAYLHLRDTYFCPPPEDWGEPLGCFDSGMTKIERMLADLRRWGEQLQTIMRPQLGS